MKKLRGIEVDFEKGRLTGHDAAWQILCTLTESSQQEFALLCPELRIEVDEVLKAMADDRRSTSAVRPTEEQIDLGRKWLEERGKNSPEGDE